MRLEAMAVKFPHVDGHPNRVAFHGVLTVVNAASDKAPAGARGHRVLLTREAAEKALPSLLGMAVDYRPGWDGHDARRTWQRVRGGPASQLFGARVASGREACPPQRSNPSQPTIGGE